MTFPVGTRIVAVPPFQVGGSDGNEPVEIIGNVVKLGITDNSQTQGGHFHEGGEDWIIRVDPTTYTTPLSVDWEVHDDGYAGGQNELGTTIVADEIGFAARLGRLWNLVSGGVWCFKTNLFIMVPIFILRVMTLRLISVLLLHPIRMESRLTWMLAGTLQ